jgi:hypothetical protein
VAYVLGNEKHHGFEQRDPLILAAPQTWLLREGWMRARIHARQPPAPDAGIDAVR